MLFVSAWAGAKYFPCSLDPGSTRFICVWPQKLCLSQTRTHAARENMLETRGSEDDSMSLRRSPRIVKPRSGLSARNVRLCAAVKSAIAPVIVS